MKEGDLENIGIMETLYTQRDQQPLNTPTVSLSDKTHRLGTLIRTSLSLRGGGVKSTLPFIFFWDSSRSFCVAEHMRPGRKRSGGLVLVLMNLIIFTLWAFHSSC